MVRPGFDEYVRVRSGVLLRFAYLLCGDRHLAEDLVQDVLVKAHRRWATIEADNPDAYFKRALVRTHVSWLRRRASSEISTPAIHDEAGHGGFDDAHASRDEMWAMLARLPRAQRAVLVLRYFEDLDDQRIAELIGTAPSTVRTHAQRGLASLREILAAKAADAPSGAGLLEKVQRGATRATRRRAIAAGGLAVIIAALAFLIPILLRPEQSPTPVEPTPTPSVTDTLALVPTTLTAPVFPFAFAYIPAGAGPAYVALYENEPVIYWGGDSGNGYADLGMAVHAQKMIGDPGEFQVGSTVTINGHTAQQWLAPPGSGNPAASLEWQQDGQWFYASGDTGAIGIDDVRAFAEGLRAGSTPSGRRGPISDVAAMMLPADHVIYEWDQDHFCTRSASAQPYTGGLCVAFGQDRGGPHARDLTLKGDPAWFYPADPQPPTLAVQRRDGRFVVISSPGAAFSEEDLVAIYEGITFYPATRQAP